MLLVVSVVPIVKYFSEPNPASESIVGFIAGVLVIAVSFLLSVISIITGIILLTPRRKGKDKHLIKELDQEIEQWPGR
jgi:hypothetical protein